MFQVIDGVAREQIIRLGLQNGLAAEVVEGLSLGNEVIVHPGNNIEDGTAVERR